jgi:hypothetical protein
MYEYLFFQLNHSTFLGLPRPEGEFRPSPHDWGQDPSPLAYSMLRDPEFKAFYR